MKKYVSLLLILPFFAFAQKKEAYKIKVKINGYKDTVCYLANYYGAKQYYKDTAYFDKNGVCTFTGNKPLPEGVYSVVTPEMKYFEMLVTSQYFEVSTDTADFVKHMSVKGNKDNELFYEYLNYIQKVAKDAEPLRKKRTELAKNEKENKKEIENIDKQLKEIEDKINAYRENIINKYPDSFIATMFKSMKEPEAPKPPKKEDGSIDSLFQYRYVKNHYWDDINFNDERLIYSPIYHNKLERYFEKIIIKHPDTIIQEADWILDKVKDSPELFKYTVHYLTNKYERSKIMGMDAVFVHMALNYYTHDKAFWADSTVIEKIRERAKTLEPLLIGKFAPALTLRDTAKKWIPLYSVNGDYTILVFWDPDCGHCKKEIPKLARYYDEIKNKHDVKVYAVSSEDGKKWKEFIRTNKLDFINVTVPHEVFQDQNLATELVLSGKTDVQSLNYHKTYDIYSTPQIYILDKDKKIIAKRLDTDLVKKVLEIEWKKNEKN
jgi:peroxiredoxin